MRRLIHAIPKILNFFEGTENGALAIVVFIYVNFRSSALAKTLASNVQERLAADAIDMLAEQKTFKNSQT